MRNQLKTLCINFVPFMVLAAAFAAVTARAAVNEPANWQFFQTPDGLVESYVENIETGSNGRLWLTYGVEKLSWMDGWPDENGELVHTEEISGFGVNPLIKEAESGALWCFSNNGILIRRGKLHRMFPLAEYEGLVPRIDTEFDDDRLQPLDHKRMLYLSPGRLELIDLASNHKSTVQQSHGSRLGMFFDIVSARNGEYWITGEHGIARFKPGAETYWKEHLPDIDGLRDFENPTLGGDGELVMLARDNHGATVIAEFDGMRWSAHGGATGKVLKAWKVENGSYWLWKDNNSLSVLRDGTEQEQEKIGILSGDYRDLAVEGNGVFWLATSHGLARYAQSIWHVPGAVKNCISRVHAIREDAAGRVWFAAVENLLMYHNGHWKTYPLPRGMTTQSYATRSICSLPDGRLAISKSEFDSMLTVFNPESERFEQIPYVSADSSAREKPYAIGRVTSRYDGSAWVRVFRRSDPPTAFRIESFDGHKFKPAVYIETASNVGFPRFIEETSDSAAWIGWVSADTSSLLRWRDGEVDDVTEFDGYQNDGIFSFCEVEPGVIWAGGRDAVQEFDGQSWRVVISGIAAVRSISRGSGGTIWVASGTGIHRYSNGSWVTNTSEDGMSNSSAYSVIEDSRGQVWVGTIQGLCRYHPEADVDAPKTLIPAGENLKETPPGGVVRINFSGMDRWKQTRSERLLFSHRLDGGEWSEFSGKNMAAFEDLDRGPHRFEVRAMDANFNVDPEPAGFEFTVLVPWYEETGFKVITGIGTVVIIVLLGYATHRHLLLEKLVVRRTSALQSVNIELENKMAELKRTRSRLLDSQKMEIIGKVASGVAHEVRNPLNAILAISEALSEEIGGNPEYRAYLDHVDIQVNRLSTLMNDLLDLGKPVKPGYFVELPLKTVCADALELCRQFSTSRDRELVFAAGKFSGEPAVMGDKTKLQQAILNLVENAIQHSPAGGKVELLLESREENMISILVRDSGPGIPPDQMQEVFKPFHTTRENGTGLGLSIVRNIVETHGGQIELLNNEPPPGLTAKITLPLCRS